MKGPRWRTDEISYLEKWWGIKSISTIARHVKRSPGSVKQKAYSLGYGAFRDNVDGMSISDLPDIIGVNTDNIYKTWITNNGMKTKLYGVYRVVTFEELARFMECHQDLWDARKCDYYYFYKYPWFTEKLKRERDTGCSEMLRKEWTFWEEQELLRLRRKGTSFRKCAEILNRSKSSVASKYDKMSGKDLKRYMENSQI